MPPETRLKLYSVKITLQVIYLVFKLVVFTKYHLRERRKRVTVKDKEA